MQRADTKIVVFRYLFRYFMMGALALGWGGGAWAQTRSLAPTILQSVVLNPCATAAVCGDGITNEESVLSPVRSSGAMSGRLPTTAAAHRQGATTYVRDAAISEQVQTAFLQGLERRLNGAQTEAIARSLRENDPVTRWAGMVSGDGLRTGDLADALASYWVLNWAMANGGESSPAEMQAVRDQVRWAVANRPALARLTDAEKQAMAEEAMLNFVYEVTGYLQARQAGNGAMLGRIAEGAELRFRREMAIDLRSLLLTSKGLEAKR